MTPDYAAVLTALYPEALWGLNDNDYATLSWDESNTVEKPSEKTLDAAWPQVKAERANRYAAQSRAAAYASESDPLMAYWLRGEGQQQPWLDKVAEIRDRYPYVEVP